MNFYAEFHAFRQALAYQRWLVEWCRAWGEITWVYEADCRRGRR